MGCVCHDTHAEVREQFAAADALLPPRGFWWVIKLGSVYCHLLSYPIPDNTIVVLYSKVLNESDLNIKSIPQNLHRYTQTQAHII